jgi:hypothetical protein
VSHRRLCQKACVAAVLVTTAAHADLAEAWRHGVKGFGGNYWLLTDRLETAQLQWSLEFGGTIRAGFSLQAGASWAGRNADGSRAAAFLGGAGLTGVWVVSHWIAIQAATDFDGASQGPALFIARVQARIALHEADCGFEILAGPDWVQTLGADAVQVRSGAGIALAVGLGCHR